MGPADLSTPITATGREMFARALLLHCPNCGSGKILRDWFHLVVSCPTCGLVFDRNEAGYEVGSLWFNLAAAEGVNTVVWIAIAATRWPNVPWHLLQWLCPVMAVVTPVIFYPFAKTLFLAFDLTLQRQR